MSQHNSLNIHSHDVIGPNWLALLVGLIACGGALVQGLLRGWNLQHVLDYLLLMLLFLALIRADHLPLLRRLSQPLWRFLLLVGLVYLALQTLSGDPYLQPMAMGVPIIYAALGYDLRRALAVGAGYLLLMVLGLGLGGPPYLEAIILPLIGFGTMMLALIAFTRLAIDQAAARRRADDLAADLARERDELARLVDENLKLQDEARTSATLAERNRLARELHDTIAQGLTAVTMQLDAAQRSFERDPARSRARLGRAYELSRQALEDVRRSVWTLAAPLVDGARLSEELADLTLRFAERSGLDARYEHQGPALRLGHAAATQALRIVQEALQNVEKHAQAHHVCVGSAVASDEVRVWVQDDGCGFDPAAAPPGAAGFGLGSLHERARLAGGRLLVESTPGAGSTITLLLAQHQEG